MKQFSIGQYVAWLMFVPLIVLAVVMGSYFLHDRFADMDSSLQETGDLIVRQLASSSEYGVFSHNQAFLQNIAEQALRQADVRGVLVLNDTAVPIARAGQFSSTFQNKILADGRELSSSMATINKSVLLSSSSSEVIWLAQAIVPALISLDDSGDTSEAKAIGLVVVEISRARHEQHKTRMLWTTVFSTLAFLGLTLYAAYLVSRRITLPISKLSYAVQQIGAGKLDTRVALSTEVRELAILAQGLNRTTAHLEQEHVVLQQCIEDATCALREKKEEAERATYDKSRFLAVASHDLRQPLHALGLYVAELQRKLCGTSQQRLVEQVGSSIDSLSELLNALLDISKLDAGAVVPAVRSFGARELLERLEADYRMLASVKNIKLTVRLCDCTISSDPQLLERILANLLSNAIRYTYQNGSILVVCRRRGNFLRIEVRDNGVGISKEDQHHIFREFFRLAQPQLDADKGLGLGLAIVTRLAKLLGHPVELRSRPGAGSVFSVQVPLALNPAKAARPMTGIDESSLSGMRVLVVDDDEAVLYSTASLLSSWGCEVNCALSRDAVEKLLGSGCVFDFIVSDYQLGLGTDGIEVIERVRAQQKHAIPCVLVSGDTSPEVLQLASASGLHLLHKPIKPAKLRSLIAHLLQNG